METPALSVYSIPGTIALDRDDKGAKEKRVRTVSHPPAIRSFAGLSHCDLSRDLFQRCNGHLHESLARRSREFPVLPCP